MRRAHTNQLIKTLGGPHKDDNIELRLSKNEASNFWETSQELKQQETSGRLVLEIALLPFPPQ